MASVRKRQWRSGGETRVAWAVDWMDASGRRHRRQFPTRREADAYRVQTESQLSTGSFRAGGQKVTMAEIAVEFLEYLKQRYQRGERMTYDTVTSYKSHFHCYILATSKTPEPRRGSRAKHFTHGIGALKVAFVTPSQVHQLRDRLRTAGLSVNTTRAVLTSLHAFFEYAKSRDYCASNPAHRVRVIGRRDEGSQRVEPPSKELLRAMLEVASPDLRVDLLFSASTGLRAGEQRALRWRHVDFDRGEVTVETRADSRGHEDGHGAKSAAGNRRVPISASLIMSLKELKARSPFSGPDELVFPSAKGGIRDHNNFRRRHFQPLFRLVAQRNDNCSHDKVEVKQFNWHGLRHFAISTWIEAGLSIKAIQTFAGHSSVQVTMDRYGHLFRSEDHHNVMNTISNALVTKVAQARD